MHSEYGFGRLVTGVVEKVEATGNTGKKVAVVDNRIKLEKRQLGCCPDCAEAKIEVYCNTAKTSFHYLLPLLLSSSSSA